MRSWLDSRAHGAARPSRRLALVAALVAASSLALAACSSDDDAADEPSSSGSAAASDAFPVTLKNTFGTTTIEKKPERVASVNWGNHDVALALGVVPVGFAKSTYGDDDGDGILPWTDEALKKLGGKAHLFDETDGIDFEGVANSSPDVVLAAYSGLTKEDYGTLTQIAPTVSFPVFAWGTNWRDMALIDGEAMGLKTQAQDLVDSVDKKIADAVAARPELKGKSFAYTWIDPTDTSKIGVYTPLDARVQLVTDFGLVVPQSVKDLAGDTDQFYTDLSSEQADKLSDVDVLVLYGDDTTLATLQADPLFGKIPAVQRGSVVVLPNDAPISAATSGPTVLSVQWALDDYLDLFEAAAKKVQ